MHDRQPSTPLDPSPAAATSAWAGKVSSRPGSPLDDALAQSAFIDDPYPVYRRLREDFPVYWSKSWGLWVLSRYADVKDVLRDPNRFSSVGRFGTWVDQLPSSLAEAVEALRRFGEGAFNIDPPEHTIVRRQLRKAFIPSEMQRLGPRIEQITEELLDGADPADFDLVDDFALPLPVKVIAEFMGATPEEAEPFKDWAATVPRFLASGRAQPAPARAAGKAIVEMESHFGAMLERRLSKPRDDLLSRLLFAPEDERIPRERLPLLAVELMIAGHLATKDLITNAIIAFHRHPDSYRVIQHDASLIPSALEEVLRYESPIQRGWRRVTESVEIHGQEIPRGELVFLMFGAANRDPSEFPDPDLFDVSRSPNRHFAFGDGIHACIGAPLARLEAPIAMRALIRRAPQLQLASEKIDLFESIHVRSANTLKLRLQ